ncbi:hypothetical protein [Larkinella soli]|uniref:hypothetical protein n=1 Tax=Larkinella soli TaxID=1770527 RepID=UPI000FFB560A|nr:hypothetical protein [Larkinella soli]
MTVTTFQGCRTEEKKDLSPAFYYWKTSFQLTPTDASLLADLKINKLYVRFFDVDLDPSTGKAAPKAPLRSFHPPVGPEIIPVVFLTNQTLLKTPASEVPGLARNILRKIQSYGRPAGLRFQEIQMDCDWTATTRARYFLLLETMRKDFPGRLSATIRLHQVKFPDRTGIPPVDRGMVMFYNMADWKKPETNNSIYDLEVADRYLAFVGKYPVPLDMVLPLFRWTVVYRNQRFLHLLNQVDREVVAGAGFLTRRNDQTFVADRDTTAFGFSVRRGDVFRTEECLPRDLLKGRDRLLSEIQNQKLTFALYHLDSTVLTPYSHAFLENLLHPAP